MSLVQDLPDLWKQKHGIFLGPNAQSPPLAAPHTPDRHGRHAGSPVKTPLHLLASSSRDELHSHTGRSASLSFDGSSYGNMGTEHDTAGHRRANGKQPLPWSSPSLRTSPTDQLIAAILDGDVQGIRAVVRSKGEDLTAEFWKDLSKSVLPLHRAVSGLLFHGSEKKLVTTIETLCQLGADVNAADHAGHTVLHKAIYTCTSKSVAAAVQSLLIRGANASARNKDGETPLHAECKR